MKPITSGTLARPSRSSFEHDIRPIFEHMSNVLDDMGGLGEHEGAHRALENLYVGAFDGV